MNKEIWKQGIKGVPYRIRVRISRKRNDEEGAKHRLFSYVQAVNTKDAKGLQTTVVSRFSEGIGSIVRNLTYNRSRTLKWVARLFLFSGSGFQ